MEEEKKNNKNSSDSRNDKRFFRKESKEKEGSEEQKTHPIIQLPEIEVPVQKEKEKAPEPPHEPPREEHKDSKEMKENPPAKAKKDSVKTGSGVNKIFRRANTSVFEFTPTMRRLIIIYALSVLLCLSFLFNIFFFQNISTLKNRVDFSTKTVEDAVVGKERVAKEKDNLLEENERLKGEITSLKSASKSLERQTELLRADLTKSKQEYIKLEETIKEYGIEVRDLAMRRIEYYEAYKSKKEHAESLAVTVENLQNTTAALKDEIASVESKHKEEIASYMQEMAFLYVKTGMYSEAIDAFKKFISLNAEDADIYYNLAILYEESQKNRDAAIRNYRKYLELKPDAEDFYEVKIKISSLERVGKVDKRETLKNFKINLDKLKF
ncbi:MAG: tetratricopeptide repeat protein [Candidatus Omnitrophica bacterium]|nr:tetratricopeptide repeat protein [Candidatus Omnitrophota bacterium]